MLTRFFGVCARGMGKLLLETLWSVLLIFLTTSAIAFWWQYLPNVKVIYLNKKNKKWKGQGAELPLEIYLTKFGDRYHVFPDCPSLKNATTELREIRVCQVCASNMRNNDNLRDHMGSRDLLRGSPRVRQFCGQAFQQRGQQQDHFASGR